MWLQCKIVNYIFYINPVIANFLFKHSHLVTIARRVGVRFNFKDILNLAEPENQPWSHAKNVTKLLHTPSYNGCIVNIAFFLLPRQQEVI